jgi:hypothetical protein
MFRVHAIMLVANLSRMLQPADRTVIGGEEPEQEELLLLELRTVVLPHCRSMGTTKARVCLPPHSKRPMRLSMAGIVLLPINVKPRDLS